MNSRIVACLLLLTLSAVAWADVESKQAATGGEQTAPAAETAESRTEAGSRIHELELSMALARDGQLGRIRSRDMQKLENAFAYIVDMLGQVDSLSQLSPQQRQSLELAQSQFDGIVRAEDENRRICKRVASTGTRLGALECLTVAQRHARARASKSMVESAQRGFCIQGGASTCVRN